MKKRIATFVSVFMMLAVALAAFAPAPAAAQEYEPNIMDIVAADGRFDTLETAIKAANLADTVASADNTFTVFAPTDAAFAALPAGVLDTLLADPEGALTNVLLYHVVPGENRAAAVLGADMLSTAQGASLDVSVRDGAAYVNDSQITVTDIEAKNGVIHVIDAVLVPGSAPAPADGEMEEMAESSGATIAEIAANDGRFDTLVAALQAAGLAETFAQPGDYTVFAPTDDAFAALPAGTVEALLADPEGQLTTILLYHVVGDSLSADQIATDDYIPTLEGRALEVEVDDNIIQNIDGANILIYDIQASNGVIHVIDRVLMP
jgi:uncharacterized surface protein with fasciclin (FAS1) repeats